jgi:uncharacterized protein YfiM (DUF2279 family)
MLWKHIMVIIMFLAIGYSQQIGIWRWADDTAEFTMDKEAHFVGSAGSYFFFRHKNYSKLESIKYSFYLGLGKECIDALLPWEHYGKWGGDGFSKYDLLYNTAGIIVGYSIDYVWKGKNVNSYYNINYYNNKIIFIMKF